MDLLSSFLFILKLIAIPLLIIALGSLLYNIYEYINRVKTRMFPRYLFQTYRQWWDMLKHSSTPSNKLRGLIAYIYPFVYFICVILIAWLIPIGSISIFPDYSLGLITVFVIFIMIPIIRAYMILRSDHEQNIIVAKKDIKKSAEYSFSLILSVVSILFLMGHYLGDRTLILNFQDIITFQTTHSLEIFGVTLPALFVFLNPFAFLAFLSAIIGYFRDTNLDIDSDEEQIRYWNPDKEYTGRKYLLILFAKCIEFVLLLTLPISLFFGSGLIHDNVYANIASYVLILFLLLLIVSFVGHGKPRTGADRKILYFIRTPLLLAFLSLAFTFYIIYFDVPFVNLISL